MEFVNKEELADAIANLKNGEQIMFDVSDEVCKKLELNAEKRNSYSSLFRSYLNSSIEVANEMNLEKLIESHAKLGLEDKKIVADTTRELVGNEAYIYILVNNINHVIRWNVKKLVIFGRG